ncbi:UNKNOWN [Stylonychia lemnae]|uniref:Uncharacterized protein n=1 Tax=Stylonychia lemnae TaxID=5949 RepID=A0A078ADT0_STYLE|nr:UNKNOWN [Stylonychia lemnae]|eukprot:CDW80006.1 UNKNOWN [Stylonychia lemnae]
MQQQRIHQKSLFKPAQYGNTFIVENLDSENYQEFVDLVAEEYHKNDPISLIVGATSFGYRECIESLKEFILSQNMGFIARCKTTGRLIGAITGEDYQAEYDFKKDKALQVYFRRLDEGKSILYSKGILKKEWKIVLITWGITRSTNMQQYIMTILSQNIMLKAKYYGFEYGVAEVNHFASYRLFLNNNYKILCSIDFHDKYEEIKDQLSQEQRDYIWQSGKSDYIFFCKLEPAIAKRYESLRAKL